MKTCDSLESFYKKYSGIHMFHETFDAICQTSFHTRFKRLEDVDVCPVIMFAYPNMQLVWKDVLQHLKDPSLPSLTIEMIELIPEKKHSSDFMCNPDMLYQAKCTFKYNSRTFSVKYCKGRGWGIYMERI